MKKISMKPSTPIALEAYAIKLCPPDVRADLCSFGLPMFVRGYVDALNEAAVMLNHLNIKPDIAVVRFLGRYDNVAGAFSAPHKGERCEYALAESLANIAKERKHEAE